MNALVEQKAPAGGYAGVQMDQHGGGGMLAPKSLGDLVHFAGVMAKADIALPKFLRGNQGACLAITMQAMRWEMDPFAVANKAYSVNDRLAYEAQLIAAVVHTRAPIARRPDYTYEGEGPTRKCIVEVEMQDGTTKRYESPEFGKILTKNSPLWKSDLDQQLGYFAIRSWARRHTPEVILGVYTPDEVETFRDIREVSTARPDVRQRLEARNQEPREGFSASGAVEAVQEIVTGASKDEAPDAATEATFTEEEVSTPADLGLKTGAQLQAEQQAADDFAGDAAPPSGPTLASRTKLYEQALAACQTIPELTAQRGKAHGLRDELDKRDPETLAIMEERFNERWAELSGEA